MIIVCCVSQAVDTHEEIADAISRPVDSTLDVSMSELEGELEEILAAAEKEKEEDAVTKALGGLSIQDSGWDRYLTYPFSLLPFCDPCKGET